MAVLKVWLDDTTYVEIGGTSDADAIHDNVSSEISAVTEKTTPVDSDLLLIEDSGASNEKKKVQVGNLPVLRNIVEDTTPQLGGNLDVNGKEIQSTTDVVVQLGDAAGAKKLIVQDSASAEQFAVDSDGNLTLSGTVDGVDVAAHNSSTTEHGATGAVVGTTNTQTLTNKTLSSPVIANFLNAQHSHLIGSTGGTLDAVAITSGTLSGARLAAKHKTEKKVYYVEDSTGTDAFPLAGVPDACTIVRVTHITDTGSCTFNLEKRSETTPFSAGTDVWSSDKTADTSFTAETSFNSAAIPADDMLYFVSSGTPTADTLVLTVEYTIDD